MRIMGLDIGGRRIGVAVSDPGGQTAQPVGVVKRDNDAAAAAEIASLAEDYEVGSIVYGVPFEEDGDFGTQAEKTLDFAEVLREKTGLPLTGHDERFSTAEAERLLISQDVPRQKRREVVDKIAAAIILQGYLDKYNG